MDFGPINLFDVLTDPLQILLLILPLKPEIRIEDSSCDVG
jgi:hypothetical protein